MNYTILQDEDPFYSFRCLQHLCGSAAVELGSPFRMASVGWSIAAHVKIETLKSFGGRTFDRLRCHKCVAGF